MQLRGVNYAVETGGGEDRWPVLLLHGFTGSAREWHPLLQLWPDAFRRVAPDLLGHGDSDAPADAARYAMPEALADLAALLDALQLERACVVGYSMGGRVALHFAAACPERVAAVVLESASPGLADPAQRAERLASDLALADRIEREGVEAFVSHWEALPLWASQARLPAEVRDALRERRLRNRARGLAGSLRGLSVGAQQPLQSRLASLRLPVLCVAGQLDPKYAALARQMAAALPQGQALLVPDAGHAVHLETPERFAREAAGFLLRAMDRS
jgi:2-succinyl-6-hydroxy-2,4-cyclohexadiene-1-carboxylate synthase